MLFELLIEVLFSFPLRYLFAIGYHAFIFSLGWPAPPIFSQHYQADLLTDLTYLGTLTGYNGAFGRVERPMPQDISLLLRGPKPWSPSAKPLDYIPAGPNIGGRVRSRAFPWSLAAT